MNMVDIIRKKRDRGTLTGEEIEYWINGAVDGSIPDYQTSALLMAIRLQGMTDREAVILTDTMAQSGSTFTAEELGGFTVDKHSTGGVGDTTTIVLIPLLAAAGLTVGKVSGPAVPGSGTAALFVAASASGPAASSPPLLTSTTRLPPFLGWSRVSGRRGKQARRQAAQHGRKRRARQQPRCAPRARAARLLSLSLTIASAVPVR